jgi:CBS domain-containing protein
MGFVEVSDCRKSDGDGAGREVRLVGDAMVAKPKVLPVGATVADLRRLFDNPRVAAAVLVDESRYAGVVDREQVADGALPDEAPAASLARWQGTTIRPDATVDEAMAIMDADGGTRLVVVGEDGVTLRGLLCLNHRRTGFCG